MNVLMSHLNSLTTANSSSAAKKEKVELTVNVSDMDISQLTSSVMTLGNNVNKYLLDVFREAYDNGLKSGYALGHQKGYDEGKEEGYTEGKNKGIREGRREGQIAIKQEFNKLTEMEQVDEEDEDSQYTHQHKRHRPFPSYFNNQYRNRQHQYNNNNNFQQLTES